MDVARFFSDRLVDMRKKRRWSQHDLAAEMDWNIGKIRRLEQCETSPSLTEIGELSNKFECFPADFFPSAKDVSGAVSVTPAQIEELKQSLLQLLRFGSEVGMFDGYDAFAASVEGRTKKQTG